MKITLIPESTTKKSLTAVSDENSVYFTPIIIHPEINKTANSVEELLSRFNRYGQLVELETSGSVRKLLVVARLEGALYHSLNLGRLPNIQLFRIESRANNVVFLWKVFRLIRELEPKSLMLIAGDLKFGLLTVLLFPNFLKKGVKKQVAVHGELGKNGVPLIKRILQYHLVKISVRRFNSVRVVSTHLRDYLIQNFKVSARKIIVAPIPVLRIESEIPVRDMHRTYSRILVLGRLHPERGIEELLDFLGKALKFFPQVNVTFIGDGNDLSKVKTWTKREQLTNRVEIVGRLEHDIVLNVLNQFDILISNAPQEGFGLATREAGLAGLAVLARSNSGTQELKASFGNSVSLYKNEDEFMYLLERILLGENPPSNSLNLRTLQLNSDLSNLRSLISSWVSP